MKRTQGVIEKGRVIELEGQKYLVISVEYGDGTVGNPWIRTLELRGIKRSD